MSILDVLSSSRVKPSPSYLTWNPRFSPLVISFRNRRHISLWAKICIFFMVLFNVTLLNRPAQNILVFDILMDLILVLLVYLRSYSSMSDRVSVYFKQHKLLLKPWFDCFLACSIIKVNCNINIKNLGLHLRVFTHLTVHIFLCLIPGKYLNKCCNNLSAIIYFLLFTIYLTYFL